MKSMLVEKAKYLAARETQGGTAKGFREWIRKATEADPRLFPADALRDEAATKAWGAHASNDKPDLFSVAGKKVPEFLTRHRKGFADGDSEDEEDFYEKVDARFATVDDYSEDAMVKLRNAARASAAAEKQAQHADECLRLARFDRAARLLDLADKPRRS